MISSTIKRAEESGKQFGIKQVRKDRMSLRVIAAAPEWIFQDDQEFW
jgi:hypothetical protein